MICPHTSHLLVPKSGQSGSCLHLFSGPAHWGLTHPMKVSFHLLPGLAVCGTSNRLLLASSAASLGPLAFHLLHWLSVPSPSPDPACCPNLIFSLSALLSLCCPVWHGPSAAPAAARVLPPPNTLGPPTARPLRPEYTIIISTSAPVLVPFLLPGMLFGLHSALSDLSLPLLKSWLQSHLLPKVFPNQFGPNETPFSELLEITVCSTQLSMNPVLSAHSDQGKCTALISTPNPKFSRAELRVSPSSPKLVRSTEQLCTRPFDR